MERFTVVGKFAKSIIVQRSKEMDSNDNLDLALIPNELKLLLEIINMEEIDNESIKQL